MAGLGCRELAKFEVAESDFVAVILKENGRSGFDSESTGFPILTLGDFRFNLITTHREFDDFDAIEPMFNMIASDEKSALVPFSYGLNSAIFAGLDQIIEGGRLVASPAAEAVGVVLVIDQLILESDIILGVREIVFQTAIPGFADFPLPDYFKVGVEIGGKNVSSAGRFPVENRPILNFPPLSGLMKFFEWVPTLQCFAVKEESPARCLFFSSQLIEISGENWVGKSAESEADSEVK